MMATNLGIAAANRADPDMAYRPRNPIATYVDEYGDERIIHAPQGKNASLRRFKGEGTPAARLNRAVAILIGRNIRARRLELGLTPAQVAERTGVTYTNPKQFLAQLEQAIRRHGVRLGTLYAIANALECEVSVLLPSVADAMSLAGVEATSVQTLAVAA